MIKVFIDGQEGTTGLKIFSRLHARKDIQLLEIQAKERKNMDARMENVCQADITFLCLPDEAAREIAKLAPETARIIDASTAHRIEDAWTYGFPEIGTDQRNRIKKSNRVSVPGCHASGFISIAKPLVDNKVISQETFLACTSITGYSGGGKAMISAYENNKEHLDKVDQSLISPRIYGLNQNHKHIPEMKKISGLSASPAFIPILSNYYSGMLVTIPIAREMLLSGYLPQEMEKLFQAYYANEKMVKVVQLDSSEKSGLLNANKMAGRDDMEILIYGNDERIMISSRYDNLGKGASGAAIQCMNIMLGIEETTSLVKGNGYEEKE